MLHECASVESVGKKSHLLIKLGLREKQTFYLSNRVWMVDGRLPSQVKDSRLSSEPSNTMCYAMEVHRLGAKADGDLLCTSSYYGLKNI
jgi:hypothetical protein